MIRALSENPSVYPWWAAQTQQLNKSVGTTDPLEAYRLTTELLRGIDKCVGDAAQLRAQMAYHVMQQESLSLTELAQRLGTSESRADQLVQVAKRLSVGKEG